MRIIPASETRRIAVSLANNKILEEVAISIHRAAFSGHMSVSFSTEGYPPDAITLAIQELTNNGYSVGSRHPTKLHIVW